MDIHHLVKMANQIGDFFAAYPDRDQAVASIAVHLKNSWDPRMRRQIIKYVDREGGTGLKDSVRDAVLTLEMGKEEGIEAPGDD
ncbi:MAG TPA: formate dehydrogenase subunit delta [Candidatus Binataceae bacterium]|jgi:formate dehydrogenase subunit delta|nr:formate dehydrogenase subunit delta [Candidatus Binataceae bacterium]